MEREQENDYTDRLSSLPDSLLCHILSFLPTKTSVSTISLVSHRYLHLWKNLQVFDFYNDYCPGVDGESEHFKHFALFVNAVLALRHSRHIRKMHLSCGDSILEDFNLISVNTWVDAAAGSHLEELHLALFSSQGLGFYLPISILSCTNLLSLSLCGQIFLELEQSSTIHLPSLKTLQLDISYVNANSVDILLSGCPILETLDLSFSPESLAKLHVPSSLKSLKVIVENDIGACLEIDAPGLKYLTLTKITFGDVAAIGNLHNVEEACLDVFSTPENEYVDPLLTLLQALSGIKHLVLCCSTAKRLLGAQSIINFSNIRFPEFCHLLHLELILPAFDPFLYNVLQKCPMLQTFIIQNDQDKSPHEYGLAVNLESVPKCLVSCLTFIHFKGYVGYWEEQEFIKYVLQNGLVLKTMLISGVLLDQMMKWEKYRFLKRFSDLPKGSAVCKVKFD
ncbi:F-box/FBD/LRR-repeat protein At4g26340-like isoform X2 [Cicer arietinum]|uniref:F-box/FBD/LRR-repeat protein At4g26340-like isoform X2 n=1 Tax=Cicer arietinum TaxID=3827 RepID=A0A3Q7XW09_CICAR|nr:F-box/FBD/LRR-repeat protein At4g26340-like isoform X2 [Cicer arietinum]